MGVNDWEGTSTLALLRERMDRLFEEQHRRDALTAEGPFTPATDVYTTDEAVVITVELPGINAADLTVEPRAGQLTVRGVRHFRGDGAAYHHLERSYGEFRCVVALPADADATRYRSRLAAGILTLEIPRSEP